MKPHPRIRKTIKWGGTVVTVLLVVVWIGSHRLGCYWILRPYGPEIPPAQEWGWMFSVFDGGIRWNHWSSRGNMAFPFDSGAFVAKQSNGFSWLPHYANALHGSRTVIPLWVPAAIVALAATLAWRLDTLARRRAKLNRCPKCGYDRTGILKDAKCPECGSDPA